MRRLAVFALALVVSCVPPGTSTSAPGTNTTAPNTSTDMTAAPVDVEPLRLSTDVALVGLSRDDGGWWLLHDRPSTTGNVTRTRQRIDANGLWATQAMEVARGTLAAPVVDGKGRVVSLVSGDPSWTLQRDEDGAEVQLGNALDEGVFANVAMDPASDAMRGAVAWWHVKSVAAHEPAGTMMVWRVIERSGQPRIAVFDRGEVRSASLFEMVDEMKQPAGSVSVAAVGDGFAVTWLDPASSLHGAWVDGRGKVTQHRVAPPAPNLGDPRHLVVGADGSLRVFSIGPGSDDATINASGFDASGRPFVPVRMREPFADAHRARAISCGGRPWLVFVRDASATEIDIRAVAIDGAKLRPAVTLRTIAVTSRQAGTALSPLELDLRVGCRGDEGAYVGLVRVDERLEQAVVVFGTWAAGSSAAKR